MSFNFKIYNTRKSTFSWALPVNSKPWTLEFMFLNIPQLFNRNTRFDNNFIVQTAFILKFFKNWKLIFVGYFCQIKGWF